jgi:hypothetical protein
MFAEASVDVVVAGQEATFRFTPSMSVMLLSVYDAKGAIAWLLTANEVIRVPAGEGIFISTPITEAPPELIAAARSAEARVRSAPPEQVSSRPSLASIRYGMVPEGYQEEAPATPLSQGGYDVRVVARNGQADAHFDVAAA